MNFSISSHLIFVSAAHLWFAPICRANETEAVANGTATANPIPLSEQYPNDHGIERDPDVLFADNFESGDLQKWDQVRGGTEVVADIFNSGERSVRMEMVRGRNEGGDAIKWFMPGADRVYARFYVRFSADYKYPHHFVTLMAGPPRNKWAAFGKAGRKPDGTYFSIGMEPWFAWGKNPPPGEIHFYSYYLDMEPDLKMDRYWGNGFFPPGPGKGSAAGRDRVIAPLDQWQCWEFMIQANSSPEVADGEQVMWVEGREIARFTGIRWSGSLEVKINCFWLQHYGFDPGDPTKSFWPESQAVWFDDVVIATRPIGPRVEE